LTAPEHVTGIEAVPMTYTWTAVERAKKVQEVILTRP
jgi:hypothetical protein